MTTMPAVPEPVRWMTTRAAAELVHRSKRTIRLWIKDGDVRARKVGGITQVRMDDVIRAKEEKDEYRNAPTFGR